MPSPPTPPAQPSPPAVNSPLESPGARSRSSPARHDNDEDIDKEKLAASRPSPDKEQNDDDDAGGDSDVDNGKDDDNDGAEVPRPSSGRLKTNKGSVDHSSRAQSKPATPSESAGKGESQGVESDEIQVVRPTGRAQGKTATSSSEEPGLSRRKRLAEQSEASSDTRKRRRVDNDQEKNDGSD